MGAARRRRPIGQLLGDAVIAFRQDLYARATAGGYQDIRAVHLQVFGALDWQGTRLRDLAARANMTPPAMAELVDELQAGGYLERLPDPRDGRAKLIRPTRKGRRALAAALRAVEAIEDEYEERLGIGRFEDLVRSLQQLAVSPARNTEADTPDSPDVSGPPRDQPVRPRRHNP